MPTDAVKVVVYVPAGRARELRRMGFDPAEWVREQAKKIMEESPLFPSVSVPAVEEREPSSHSPEETVVVGVAASSRSSTVCPMDAPRGAKCKVCGKVHQP